jgi:hypothetical protein
MKPLEENGNKIGIMKQMYEEVLRTFDDFEGHFQIRSSEEAPFKRYLRRSEKPTLEEELLRFFPLSAKILSRIMLTQCAYEILCSCK